MLCCSAEAMGSGARAVGGVWWVVVVVEDSPLLAKEPDASIVGGGVWFVVWVGCVVDGVISVVGGVVVVVVRCGSVCCCVAACDKMGGVGVDVLTGASGSVTEVVAPS
jgi:hypothetical protein